MGLSYHYLSDDILSLLSSLSSLLLCPSFFLLTEIERWNISGWDFKTMLPYYIKTENNTGALTQNSPWHGYEGNHFSKRYITKHSNKSIY